MRSVAIPLTLLAVAASAGCGTSNAVMPLHGEDPASLAVSGDRAAWLSRTGATRALDELRQALRKRDWDAALARLGPATRAALGRAATAAGTDAAGVLAKGGVAGLSLPGADDPLAVLSSSAKATVAEGSAFDPARRNVRLKVRLEGAATDVEVPALYAETGWQVELVRLMDAPGVGR